MKNIVRSSRAYFIALFSFHVFLSLLTGQAAAQIVPPELLQRVAALETQCRSLESGYEFDQIKQTAADAKQITDEATALLATGLNNAFKQKLYYCRGLASAFPAYSHRFEHNRMADNIFHVNWKNRYDLAYTAEEAEALRHAAADFRLAIAAAGEFLPKTLPAKIDDTDGAQKMIRLVATGRLTAAMGYASALLEIATRSTQTENDFALAAAAATNALNYIPLFESDVTRKAELYHLRGCALIGAGKSFSQAAAEFDARFALRPESAFVLHSQARRCFMQMGDVRAANAYTLHLAALMKARNLATRSIAENTKVETEFTRLQSPPTQLPLSILRFGIAELSAGKPEAETYLAAARKLSLQRALPLVLLAQLKYQQKKPDDAIRYATLALAIEPNNTGALAARGFAYAALSDAVNAEKDLSAAIAANAELAFAYGVYAARARIYQATGKADLANVDLARQQELLAAFQ